MRGRQPHQELHVSPTLYEQCVASLTYHRIYMSKGYEMGPMVYRPNLLIIIGKYSTPNSP